jgi:sugar/nucleoside kinase (ribokinase family)
VVTAAPIDPSEIPELSDIQFLTIGSDSWTSFRNEYRGDRRVQTWVSSAPPIRTEDVPMKWQLAEIVHLAPIAQEVSPDFILGCPSGLCCATIQGWLRGKTSSSAVLVEVNADLERALRYLDVGIMSGEDIQNDQVLLAQLATWSRSLVVTRGPDGCDILEEGGARHVRTKPVQLADPTGAGDMFAAAYFIAFSKNRDADAAARFANEFAGWILEEPGRLDLTPGDTPFDL